MKEKIKKVLIQSNRLLSWILGSIAWTIVLTIAVAIKGVITSKMIYEALINFNLLYFFLAISIASTIYFSIRLLQQHWKKVSKELFEEFKNITLGFEKIFDSRRNPLVGFLEELDAEDSHISRVQTPLKNYIDRSFRQFMKNIEMFEFDRTKTHFGRLVDEFENIYFAYEDLFVAPLEGRREEIAKNVGLKKRFNRFVGDYEYLRRQYIDYGEKINRLFGSRVIRTDFDFVEKV